MTTYYKAVRLDGTDFHTGTVQWAPPDGHEGDWVVLHPTATEIGDRPSEYLSVSTVATACKGMKWPCRLLTVEAVGDVIKPEPGLLPNKLAGVAFRVTGELPAHEALGPQGVHVAAFIEQAHQITPNQLLAIAAVRDAVWNTAWDDSWDAVWDATSADARAAARAAASDAAWDAVRDAAKSAAWAAAAALVARDLINTEDYNTLTRPWRTVIGPIHPDDPELTPKEY